MFATASRLARSSVAIVGAGSQGRRLAYMWSSRGNDVHLIDGQPSQLQASVDNVKQFRSQLNSSGHFGQIHTHLPDSLKDVLCLSWLVVEVSKQTSEGRVRDVDKPDLQCIPERLPLKRAVIAQLDDLAPTDTIVASNSSSYCCSELVEGLDLKNQKRVLSAHTYWPPETTVIEIMGHKATEPSLIQTMMEQCAAHGFSPFHVRSPSMGYIYNRIWAAIKREALLTAAEGAGTPEEIDAIFRGVLKTAKGPFELMDIVGLDVVFDIEQHYATARRDIPEEPRSYLGKYLQNGHLGVKSGRGFYQYDSPESI
ncbi:hypothetical protein QQS21_004405 [Conoideocrella luteorostrata]|uniref:3-hydroxyacyl-CoA dehydrogenase n=1 Tax=Conoideocrella luteorostrata TaxID=1105319 RepID=A0AAJ0CRI0_9HYPO|nr:hypothetical protein QQS21_004405 [Conoideocrella luteorostrata]